MKIEKIALGVIVLTAIAVLLVSSAAATDNMLLFVPDDSIAPDGNCVSVDVYTDINETDEAISTSFDIEYDSNCVANYPGFTAATDWNAVTYSNPLSGLCRFTTTVGLNPPISGHKKVGTLELCCADPCCGSWLTFTNALYQDGVLNTLTPATDDGTFLCGDAIEVTKKVWDESTSSWIDDLGPLDSSWYGKEVTFQITVGANCMDLSAVALTDVLDDSLSYNDSASIPPTSVVGQTITWSLGSLTASASQTITFDATIVGYGTDYNTATATATVDLLGVEVSDSDQASVTTMPPAGIEVNKTVWDGTAWVEEVTGAAIGDTYRFRCEVHNTGAPGMDLTNIEVGDVISPSLEYADNAMLMTPNGVWRSIEPPTSQTTGPNGETIVEWTIDNFLQDPLILQPCQTFVVEYDVNVVGYGYDCNVQYASAYCEAALSDVEGEDTACIYTPEPDMTVTDITVNYDASSVEDLAIGPLPPGTKTQSNNISADVTELNGIDVAFPFDVTFEIDGTPVCTVPVLSLGAGATTTVYCDNQFFPIAGNTYTIKVTADSGVDIPETDEGNNDMSETLTAIVNGYKGDGWQDGRNIANLQCHEQGTINLTYSSGDSYYLSGYYSKWDTYEVHWTPGDFNIPPTDSSIKKARLYAYYHADQYGDKWANLNMEFNGLAKTPVAHYSDGKGFGGWDYSSDYGSLVYDVTTEFMVTSDNIAILTNNNPAEPKGISMEAMLLVVVYDNPETEPDRIIWINEGCDLLKASSTYGVSPEEATTYAPFEGCEPIPMNEVVGAKLITVAQTGNKGDDNNRLYFNDDGEWHGLWPDGYVSGTNIGIHEADVKPYLKATDNIAAYQDNGDMFAVANAFMVVEKGKGTIEVVAPEVCVGVTEQFDVLINVIPVTPVYGVEYKLSFDSSVIHAEWQNEGDFLKQGGASTNVYINDIDNGAGTVSFAVTRTGVSTGATEPGTLATIHFTATKLGANTGLSLTIVKASDPDALPIPMDTFDSTVSVCNNEPPIAVARSLFTYNNVGTKYMSKTYLDSEGSNDPDGCITNYRWYFGDGNYGAGETYEHVYGSWNWNGASYDPFDVILTVEDNGVPMMDDSTTIPVNVYIAGDANGDGEVDIFDGVIVGLEWEKECTGGSWDSDRSDKGDLNNDCIVDIFDGVIVGANWEHTAW